MVQANAAADRHPFRYGIFRQDKPADEGYSPDVVHYEINEAHYDDFE